MNALWESIVRTLTPVIVGYVLAWVATLDIELDEQFAPALTALVGAVLSGIYYVAVRLLETYVTPKFGWLIGLAKPPVYDATTKDAVLAKHAILSPDEKNADEQAALSRVTVSPIDLTENGGMRLEVGSVDGEGHGAVRSDQEVRTRPSITLTNPVTRDLPTLDS